MFARESKVFFLWQTIFIKFINFHIRNADDIVEYYVNMLLRNKTEEIQVNALVHAPTLFPFVNEQDLFLDVLFKLGVVASADIKKIVHEVTQFLY